MSETVTASVHETRRFQLDDTFALRIPSDAQVSPDATCVAFALTEADRENDENVTTIWIVPVEGGAPASTPDS